MADQGATQLAEVYPPDFYAGLQDEVARSARRIAPLVVDLVRPESVVDVGCGTGAWLATFGDLGIEHLLGIDGPHVARESLQIDADDFVRHDLQRPLELDGATTGPFDLVVSLEVAEHLPADRARGFVADLVSLGPVVLFSAAIPGQGGVHHVNEQWPGYWSALFHEMGYEAIDALRPKVWSDLDVAPWYAQNVLIYADLEALAEPIARRLRAAGRVGRPHAAVHPDVHRQFLRRLGTEGVRAVIGSLAEPGATVALLDDHALGVESLPAQTVLPFPCVDGAYAGTPSGDDEARRALARLDSQGVRLLAVATTSLWWLEEYPGFATALEEDWELRWEGELARVYART